MKISGNFDVRITSDMLNTDDVTLFGEHDEYFKIPVIDTGVKVAFGFMMDMTAAKAGWLEAAPEQSGLYLIINREHHNQSIYIMACVSPRRYTEAEREEILAEHEGEERECVALTIQIMNDAPCRITDRVCAWLHKDEAANIYGAVDRPYFVAPWGAVYWIAEDAIDFNDKGVCAEFIQTSYIVKAGDPFAIFRDESFEGAYFSYDSDTGELTFNLMFDEDEGDPLYGKDRWFCMVGGISEQLRSRLMSVDKEPCLCEYGEQHKAS